MSQETGRLNQSVPPGYGSRSIAGEISDYWRIRMSGYPDRSLFRIVAYLVEGFLIGLFFYLWLEYTRTEALFKTYYPVFVGITIIFWHYLVAEVGGRYVYTRLKSSRLTVGKFWGISFAGALFGYMMIYLNGQCPGIAHYYPDISSFYSSHSSPTQVRLAVFYKTVLVPWAVTTYLLIQGELKKQIADELVSIKEINETLAGKEPEDHPQEMILKGGFAPSKSEYDEKAGGISVPLKNGIKKISFIDLYYIAVEDHYCRFVFNAGDKVHEELVRLSLKKALANLPSGLFARVHRSYAVNLQHVRHIKKEGQAYRLYIEGIDSFIPASRHRAHIYLPTLKEILNQSAD